MAVSVKCQLPGNIINQINNIYNFANITPKRSTTSKLQLTIHPDNLIRHNDILPQADVPNYPFEKELANIMESNLDEAKCTSEAGKVQIRRARKTYELRKKTYLMLPENVRMEIKNTFLTMARGNNRYAASLRELLRWLGRFDGLSDKQQDKLVRNIHANYVLNPKLNFEENKDWITFEFKGMGKETVIMFDALKEICMVLPSRKQSAIIDYYAQLQWDYVILLKAEEEAFSRAMRALTKQLDAYESKNDTVLSKLKEYNDVVRNYEALLKDVQTIKALKKAYVNISAEMQADAEDKRLLFKGDFDKQPEFVFSQHMMKEQDWKPFKVCFIKDPREYPNDDSEADWYYLPINPKTHPPKSALAVFIYEIKEKKVNPLVIRYHLERDIVALEEYLNNQNIKRDEEKGLYYIDLKTIRNFFKKAFILREQGVSVSNLK